MGIRRRRPGGGAPDRSRPLEAYLGDHLVLLSAGAALARRMAGRAGPELAALLREVREALGADRRAVLLVMDERGMRRPRLKPALGEVAERAGRLKPNGTLIRRSPVTPLVELEGLAMVLEGVRARWASLDAGNAVAGADPGGRAERAAGLAARAEAIRLRLAPDALAPG
jgi:hypothetical protein